MGHSLEERRNDDRKKWRSKIRVADRLPRID